MSKTIRLNIIPNHNTRAAQIKVLTANIEIPTKKIKMTLKLPVSDNEVLLEMVKRDTLCLHLVHTDQSHLGVGRRFLVAAPGDREVMWLRASNLVIKMF